jgi:hypothetical protein
MLDVMARRLERLDGERESFLSTLRSASEGRLRFRPSPGAWSMLEVAEHLVLAEEKSLLGMLKGAPVGTTVTVIARTRMAMVRLVMHTDIRVKVPVSRVVPEGRASLSELEARWAVARRDLGTAVESVTEGDAGRARFRHPIAGWVTAGEGVAFLADHIRHHARQVGRITRARGCPLS